ncbi:MAG TPA: glycosyltransferase family 4 protein [Xanthobacteraceae bacterium]|nr:glycosyltransferase family 4 protein [Xanthobacteraceae bacterium]
MRLTILQVAYPLAPVGPDTAGGAEQILGHIDRALVEAGHRSLVIARADSQTAGTLVPVPRMDGPLDDDAIRAAHRHHAMAIQMALARWPVDLIHMHGVDFHAYLPPRGVPVLATLHLPVDWYPPEALSPSRPDTWLHCVSATQHATCRDSRCLLPPIENGVPVPASLPRQAKRRFALAMARICPEKGIHHAIDAAKRAGIPLLIAGEVFNYPAHRRYFEEQVAPRLDPARRFIGQVGSRRKQRLLAAARCLLVPSLVPETSSLVAREALAAGTPVIAFAQGALPQLISHGRTGFLVRSVDEMAAAIRAAHGIDPNACREAARPFSLDRMIEQYFALYRRLVRSHHAPMAGTA